MTRKKRVSRVLYGAFVALVAAFTVSNIWQVAKVVFGEPDSAAEAARVPKVGEACGKALDVRFRAIAVAQAAASLEKDAESAMKKYASVRGSWRDSAENHPQKEDQACAGDPHGVEAVAALDRLDRAAQAHAVREARELSPVRLAAQSFISGPR